jgi:hypothetical protein
MDETSDVVALPSFKLHDAVLAIKIDPKVLCKFLRELNFIAECMSVPLPFLPAVHGDNEAKLFVCVVSVMDRASDAYHVTLEWCNFVDGKTTFPKLPVYRRAYFDRYLRNRMECKTPFPV